MSKINKVIKKFIKNKLSLDIPDSKLDRKIKYYDFENLTIVCWNIKLTLHQDYLHIP